MARVFVVEITTELKEVCTEIPQRPGSRRIEFFKDVKIKNPLKKSLCASLCLLSVSCGKINNHYFQFGAPHSI